MDFFPPPPEPSRSELDEPDEPPQPVWMAAPDDVVPGVVPVELILGRSDSTVVLLTGVRAFPVGLQMQLGVRVRGPVRNRDLHSEVFDGPYNHDMDAQWQARRLKWGFELADGTRVTNVDHLLDQGPSSPGPAHYGPLPDASGTPRRPVLMGGGGGGGVRSVDRDYWLWPLPPPGRLRVACEWLAQGIELTVQELDSAALLAAAERARPLWPTA